MNAKIFRHVPLLVFSDDWGRHPSSSQHLIRHLLPSREVVWVNTIGTRPPRFDRQTLRRIGEKILHWSRPTATANGQAPTVAPLVVSPKMWPSFASPLYRRLNRWMLLRSLKPIVASLSEPPIVVTTLPLVADLVGHLPAKRWVYYCVDDFSVWPGYDGETMQLMERTLVPRMDRIIAVSSKLVEHVHALGKPAELLTHGVDLQGWQAIDTERMPEELIGLEPPFVVFWGVIDRRMDTSYVACLASKLEAGTIVMFGPQEDPDPLLLGLPRVAIRPAVPFARLPSIAAAASVLIMPYADLPVTRAIQPLKLKEYLATGRPSVVRGLPSTYPWQDACDVRDTPEAFAETVCGRIESGLPADQQAARMRLTSEGWAQKAALFSRWIET